MRATGYWTDAPDGSGRHYGLRISARDRDTYFDPYWLSVTLKIDGRTISVDITPSFWKRCTELRSAAIGKYMLRKGLAPWPKGQPPVFDLVPEGEAVFRLEPTETPSHQTRHVAEP
jgi:hypothetical protein